MILRITALAGLLALTACQSTDRAAVSAPVPPASVAEPEPVDPSLPRIRPLAEDSGAA